MKLLIFLFSIAFFIFDIQATPTSLFWTNASTDIQQQGTCNINYDTYFSLRHRKSDPRIPPDFGIEFGLFSFDKIAAEAGFDFLCGAKDPWYFNAKIGFSEEDLLFKGCPSFNIGISEVGTKRGKTDYNVVDVIFGKTFSSINFRLFGGLYSGKKTIGKDTKGFMVGLSKPFFHSTYHDGTEYDRLVFMADYASGKNVVGGGGFGLTYYFTPTIDIMTGPVWFHDRKVNGRWKWTIQIDIGLDFANFLK